MSVILQEKFQLTEKQIDQVSEKIAEFSKAYKIERKNALRTRLTLEELLIRVMEQSSSPVECEFLLEKKFGTGYAHIYYHGAPYDPVADSENADELSNQLLTNLGLNPVWRYHHNRNEISLCFFKSTKGSAFYILGAILLAVVLGLLGSFIPDAVKTPLSAYLLNPLSDAFLGQLNTFAGAIIFTAIVNGINSSGNLTSFGKIGKRMLLHFFLIVNAAAILAMTLQLPFYALNWSRQTDAGESQAAKVSEMLWGILPHNLVQPFVDGNYLQIMVLAFMIGIALLIVKEQTEGLRKLMDELNTVLLFIMKKISALLPVFIFAVLLDRFWSGSFAAVADAWKPVTVMVVLCTAATIISLTVSAVRLRVNPVKLFQVMLPAWIIGLTTSSTISAYSTILSIMEEKLGVSKTFSRVSLPIANQLFSPTKVFYMITMVIYFAEKYAVTIDVSWIVIAIVLCVTISMAAPPIPGAVLICFGLLSNGLGIPLEAIGVISTIDFVVDAVNTATVCVLRMSELTLQANANGELNKEVLHKVR